MANEQDAGLAQQGPTANKGPDSAILASASVKAVGATTTALAGGTVGAMIGVFVTTSAGPIAGGVIGALVVTNVALAFRAALSRLRGHPIPATAAMKLVVTAHQVSLSRRRRLAQASGAAPLVAWNREQILDHHVHTSRLKAAIGRLEFGTADGVIRLEGRRAELETLNRVL